MENAPDDCVNLILKARTLLENHAIGRLDDNGMVREIYALFAGVKCRTIVERALPPVDLKHVQSK